MLIDTQVSTNVMMILYDSINYLIRRRFINETIMLLV